jgi:hypothetical protein
MSRIRWYGVLLGLSLISAPVRAAGDIDLALVLVTDVSRSIDHSEFHLEKEGYAAAFTSERTLAAIKAGANGAIAVAYVEFGSPSEVKTVVNWRVINDAASARAFVEEVSAAPRSFWGRTAIGSGIEHAVAMLREMHATRRTIDVCGDGTNNSGPEVGSVRDEAVEEGITINGLAIVNEHPVAWAYAHVQPPGGLPHYYQENVAGGPGNFVLEVKDFHAFADAMTRKLIAEISGRQPDTRFAALKR